MSLLSYDNITIVKVSVIIPAYNEEKNIRKCIVAIQNQTSKPDEIIVVDNNSTDKTSEIAKSMGVQVVFESRKGTSYARNAGYEKSHGDIILRTDADTIVPKNWVERMKEGFSRKEVGIVCGGVRYYNNHLNWISHLLIFWVDDFFGYKAITGPNYGIRRTVWEKIKKDIHNDNRKFHEDLDLAIHAQNHCQYVRYYDLLVSSSTRLFSSYYIFFVIYPIKSLNTLFLKEHRRLSNSIFLKHT